MSAQYLARKAEQMPDYQFLAAAGKPDDAFLRAEADDIVR
jgi:hypothetical protein